MHLRPALLALASALVLVSSVPTTAHAQTTGAIGYYYTQTNGGQDEQNTETEQPLNECLPITEIKSYEETYAYSPQNLNPDTYADVYPQDNCQGAMRRIKFGDPRDPSIHFRTVEFVPVSGG
ncbi:hypothetical protein AB0A70_12800 [Streptomyces morookaense]|uniref:hypothetical protein n=1 Tax=Streptomyces morookaense TaxID=1970 RepID=UPI0033D388F7